MSEKKWSTLTKMNSNRGGDNKITRIIRHNFYWFYKCISIEKYPLTAGSRASKYITQGLAFLFLVNLNEIWLHEKNVFLSYWIFFFKLTWKNVIFFFNQNFFLDQFFFSKQKQNEKFSYNHFPFSLARNRKALLFACKHKH